MPAADLGNLAQRIREAAVVLDNGEVLWPFEVATDAVEELARLNRVVLGVDARERNNSGFVTEVALGTYQPSGGRGDVESGRAAAVESIGRAEAVTGWSRPLILVTW
jgi:hypothetical protein